MPQATVLVVDDNHQNLQILDNMLKKNGYHTVAAYSGKEALAHIAQQAPDLVLLDIMMPDIDGFEVCKRFKETPGMEHVPVIFISALTETMDKLAGFKAGAVDYITKPFIREEVLARVNVHIQLKLALEKLAHLAETDPLTGLHNRGTLEEVMQQEMHNALMRQHSMTLCYLDVDKLKQVNDTCGHDAGDQLLNIFAQSLEKHTRQSDAVFRVGGDEFLLIFPCTTPKGAQVLIDRIRESLQNERICGNPIEFSYGFAEYANDNTLTMQDLIKAADAQMYLMKRRKKAQS